MPPLPLNTTSPVMSATLSLCCLVLLSDKCLVAGYVAGKLYDLAGFIKDAYSGGRKKSRVCPIKELTDEAE